MLFRSRRWGSVRLFVVSNKQDFMSSGAIYSAVLQEIKYKETIRIFGESKRDINRSWLNKHYIAEIDNRNVTFRVELPASNYDNNN